MEHVLQARRNCYLLDKFMIVLSVALKLSVRIYDYRNHSNSSHTQREIVFRHGDNSARVCSVVTIDPTTIYFYDQMAFH